MYLTWLDSNSWLIEIAGQRVLLDPWLVDSLVFGNQAWFFKGDRPIPCAIPQNIDLILLSQGLEDHAHPPTLKQLDRKIPVVASPNAAKVVNALGYQQVTALAHGETFVLAEQLEIRAIPGSELGPFLTENGYLLRDLASGKSLYYEPHGYHSERLKAFTPVDVVITPVIDLTVPLLGSVIQGNKTALDALKMLQPKYLLPTAAGGEVVFTGLLNAVLQTAGSIEKMRSQIEQHHLSTQLLDVKPGDRVEILL
jgi:L-ascorbate metabolism protein UlaG (beta-lactamase superfamily)